MAGVPANLERKADKLDELLSPQFLAADGVVKIALDRLQELRFRDDEECDFARAENEALFLRRRHLGVTKKREFKMGLAFSGGGIRSAAFNCGLLASLAESEPAAQAAGLSENSRLRLFDYLSSVSGGGYTACSYLTFLKAKLDGESLKHVVEEVAKKMTPNASYLGKCDSYWPPLVILLRFIVPLLLNVFTFFIMAFPISLVMEAYFPGVVSTAKNPDNIELQVPEFVALGVLMIVLGSAAFSMGVIDKKCNRGSFFIFGALKRLFGAAFLGIFILVIIIAAINLDPYLWDRNSYNFEARSIILISLGAAVLIGLGLFICAAVPPQDNVGAFVKLFLGVLTMFGIYVSSWIVQWRLKGNYVQPNELAFIHTPYSEDVYRGLLLTSIGWWIFLNIFFEWQKKLVHKFWRERLCESFFEENNQYVTLQQSIGPCTPYYISMVTQNHFLMKRDGPTNHPFELTPNHMGICSQPMSKHRPTAHHFTLGHACAISSAAISTHMGDYDLFFLYPLMSVLSINVGDFVLSDRVSTEKMRRPEMVFHGLIAASLALAYYEEQHRATIIIVAGILYGIFVGASFLVAVPKLREYLLWTSYSPIIMQLQLLLCYVHQSDQPSAKMFLSDGGHTENLAALPLLKRQCRIILIGDAGEYSDNDSSDLLNLRRFEYRPEFGSFSIENLDPKRICQGRATHSVHRIMYNVQAPANWPQNSELSVNARDRSESFDDAKSRRGCCCSFCHGTLDCKNIVYLLGWFACLGLIPVVLVAWCQFQFKWDVSYFYLLIWVLTVVLLAVVCFVIICCNWLPTGFPNHSTVNQFFTREQFGDYYKLGLHNCNALLDHLDQAIAKVDDPTIDADIGYLIYVKMKVFESQ